MELDVFAQLVHGTVLHHYIPHYVFNEPCTSFWPGTFGNHVLTLSQSHVEVSDKILGFLSQVADIKVLTIRLVRKCLECLPKLSKFALQVANILSKIPVSGAYYVQESVLLFLV